MEGDIGVGLENEYHIPDGRQEPKITPPREQHVPVRGEWTPGRLQKPDVKGARQEHDRRAQAPGREESRPCSRYWIPGPETQGPTPALMELPVLRSSQITMQSHKHSQGVRVGKNR